MKRRNFVALFIVAPIFAGALPAYAIDIYINGQKVRGITNQTFQNCVVTFNARGDIYITVPGMKVLPTAARGEQATQQVNPSPNLKYRYFLYTQTNAPGKVPFMFEVLVNDRLVKKFSSNQVRLDVELTLFLKPGSNKITIRSTQTDDPPGEVSDKFTIFIGRGAPKNDILEINEILLRYERSGIDHGDATNTFYIQAQ